jgi:cobyrinic acid a,c-diamide synthase
VLHEFPLIPHRFSYLIDKRGLMRIYRRILLGKPVQDRFGVCRSIMFGNPPRIILSALKGGSGKTILCLGLASAWRKRGQKVAPFKKGPDFIDAGWLSYAAGSLCRNLDPFLMSSEQIIHSFLENSSGTDVSLIEGNRGLFDGLDPDGCCSTAELGKILKCPVIIIVDVAMVTRTVAALVMGCQKFDPELDIKGIILNRVAGSRQESVIRNALHQYCGLPVLGSVPKLKENLFPERHMGLIPHLENEHARKAMDWACGVVEENIDIDSLRTIAKTEWFIDAPFQGSQIGTSPSAKEKPKIGVIKDRAFWFYYPENFERLEQLGATLIEIDSISGRLLSDLDALYIGGGFPETQAQALADNRSFRVSLREKIEGGLPVYAECGGLMYLGENLIVGEKSFPMVGALPMDIVLERKPQGHGYTVLEVMEQNPYYKIGEVFKGHEFHYSKALIKDTRGMTFTFKVLRGHGIDGVKDGLCKKNLLATYTHLHAGGETRWAQALFHAALQNRRRGAAE